MQFPGYRARRVRRRASSRALLDETQIAPAHLIGLIRVCKGKGVKRPSAVQGCFEVSADLLSEPVRELAGAGVGGIYLAAVGDERDELARAAVSAEGTLPRAIKRARETSPDMMLIGEIDPAQYTKDGQGGVVQRGELDNDATLDMLAEMAVVLAKAGADFVAPGASLDGQVGWIRETLDEENHDQVGVVPCTARFRSAFSRSSGSEQARTRRHRDHLIGPGNVREAMREAMLDVDEGADMLMVRPALPFLDVLTRYSDEFELPLLGLVDDAECALLGAASEAGVIERGPALLEWLTALRRAGADGIVTPLALETVRALQG